MCCVLVTSLVRVVMSLRVNGHLSFQVELVGLPPYRTTRYVRKKILVCVRPRLQQVFLGNARGSVPQNAHFRLFPAVAAHALDSTVGWLMA